MVKLFEGITCWSWLQVNTVAPCLKQHRTDRSPSVTQSYLWLRVCPKMPAFMSLKEWKCFDLRKTWHGTDLIKKLPKNLGLLRHVFYFWQMKYGTEWQLLFLTQTSRNRGGGGSLNNVLYGRLRLYVQSLTVLYIPFLTEKAYTL